MQDTIFALATGSLGCAVAIVRVSGSLVRDIARSFCGHLPKPRLASLTRIIDPEAGEEIDSGLVLFFPGPASFTGEDCLEFQLHGSRAVIARLLTALSKVPGVRIAEPGEFIRRAFDNGKMPLTSVEGIADLIDARTEEQRKQALFQSGGHLAEWSDEWRRQLLEALALVEAEIDFADEGDAPAAVLPDVRAILRDLSFSIDSALESAFRGERIREGFRIVIAGPPNVGKSTLMNAFVRRDVAIVTEHAGTTRDLIEVEFDLGGFPVIISDTAGLRETDNPVEIIGIDRTKRALEKADLVLWLYEGIGPGPSARPEECCSYIVATKADLSTAHPNWADFSISVRTGEGFDDLLNGLRQLVESRMTGEPSLIANQRQRSHIEAAARHLKLGMSEDRSELELIADDLRRSAEELQGLSGKIGSEDVLGVIFSRFCMGK